MIYLEENEKYEIRNKVVELEKKINENQERLNRIESILKITNNNSKITINTLDFLAEKLNVEKTDLVRIFDLYNGDLFIIHKFPKEMGIYERTQKTLILILFGFKEILGLSEVHSKVIREKLTFLEIDLHNLERNVEDIIPMYVIKRIGEDSRNLYRLTENGEIEAKNLILDLIGEFNKNE